jgi:hypothetical protein
MAAGGCRSSAPAASTLLAVKGQLPKAWLKQLPSPWQPKLLEEPQQLLNLVEQGTLEPGLLALGDGWAQQLDHARLKPLEADALLAQLAPLAAAPSRLFAPPGSVPVAFPWAFGTWLVLLRSRADLDRQRSRGWELLLDPSLQGRLVLPSSPRVVIDLALRQLGLDPASSSALEAPGLIDQVRRLAQQALAFDDSQGLNLLLAAEADAAVVPSHQAIPLLQKDPRLTAFLPETGSPLWWQLLLRPAPLTQGQELPPLPLEWLRDGLTAPLLDRLLAAGWVPPLPRAQLEPLLRSWPERLRGLLLPPEPVLSRCTNLVVLTGLERRRWQAIWDQALSG